MRYILMLFFAVLFYGCGSADHPTSKIFDVHLHGDATPAKQLSNLAANGVYTLAVSTSWQDQQKYQSNKKVNVLHGLFVPCPNGKVPYSKQSCFDDGKEWPDASWVEQQIVEKKIDFIGEALTQYNGISSSDTLMYPYYALAVKYNLPVGIHTGSAGPDHGCPNFKEEMGNPLLLKEALQKFPNLKVWFMHGGGPYVKECIEMMKTYTGLYADISVLNNPNIIPAKDFAAVIKEFIDAGLEDRLMFGSDNADIKECIKSVNELRFLSIQQKEKIFHQNATKFFNQ